jgi:hypothetical protein
MSLSASELWSTLQTAFKTRAAPAPTVVTRSPPQETAMTTPVAALLFSVAAVAAFDPALAEGRRGDHPAVVVQRLQHAAGYDYASKFYPHPAGFYLLARAPEDEARMLAAARAARIDTAPDDEDDVPGLVARR